MQVPLFKKQLVLVGGGHANVQVMVAFAQRPLADVSIILVSDRVMAGYSGMLPGWIAGQYNKDQSHIDLARLCKVCGITFIHDRLVAINANEQLVRCRQHPDIYYDILSINTGSLPLNSSLNTPDNVLPIKPVETFIRAFATQLEKQGLSAKITIVGGGVAAVEVTFSLLQRYREYSDLKFQLCHRGTQLLTNVNAFARRRLRSKLHSMGVDVHSDFNLLKSNDNYLEAENGTQLESDITVLCTGGTPPEWLEDCALETSADGFISVTPQLQSSSHDNVFAAGDVAEIVGQKLERAGVFAVRQGVYLAKNCRNALSEQALETYRPQKRFLKLISTGKQSALAAKGFLAFNGHWVWRWKHYIDEKFVNRFNDFKLMQRQQVATALPLDEEMRCNGCAAKIENAILRQSLKVFGVDKETKFSDDAAAISVPKDKILIQSVDFYRAIIDDPYINAQVTLNHALNDCYAMGAIPHSVQVMLGVVAASDAIQANLLTRINTAIIDGLKESGASVVGGHTAETSEPTLGFTVNSFANQDLLWEKGTIKNGDDLILVKPIGSGVMFAGHQQGLANGEDIEACIENMLQSNHDAAMALREFPVNACTDISGFGLSGHLYEMLPDTGFSIEINLSNLPTLPGALTLLENGIRSSLHAANRAGSEQIKNLETMKDHEKVELLFDPQTSGGLLFSLPPANSADALKEVHQRGYRAVIIGRVSQPEAILGKPSTLAVTS